MEERSNVYNEQEEQEEQEVSDTVQANLDMERELYENANRSFDDYFLADGSRNGS